MSWFTYEHRSLDNGAAAYCYDELLWIVDGAPGPQLDGYHLLAGAIPGDAADPTAPAANEMAVRMCCKAGCDVCHTRPPCGGPPASQLLALGPKTIALDPDARLGYVEATRRYELAVDGRRIPVLSSPKLREQLEAWHQVAFAGRVDDAGAPLEVVYHLYRVALIPSQRAGELDPLDGMVIAVPVPPQRIAPIRHAP